MDDTERDINCGELLCKEKEELEELRQRALTTIVKLPEEKQVELWNILQRLK